MELSRPTRGAGLWARLVQESRPGCLLLGSSGCRLMISVLLA